MPDDMKPDETYRGDSEVYNAVEATGAALGWPAAEARALADSLVGSPRVFRHVDGRMHVRLRDRAPLPATKRNVEQLARELSAGADAKVLAEKKRASFNRI